MEFKGSKHRGVDDAYNMSRLIEFIFPKRAGL